jgi:NADH-quinone oxidoreductase subunit M
MDFLKTVPVLSIITFWPLLGALVLMFLKDDRRIKQLATLWTLVPLVLSVYLWFGYNRVVGGLQFEQLIPWIPQIKVYYHVGVDGFSIPLIFLTALLMPISLWYSSQTIKSRVKEYYILFLLLAMGMFGVFISLDLFLFYVFFEIGLVPMYFLIGIWGGPRKDYAAIKFFLYTLAGSVLMLLAIIAVGFNTGSFSLVREGMQSAILAAHHIPVAPIPFKDAPTSTAAVLAFLGIFIALAIKVPLFPFHTWLPDAHTEAPTAGSVILAGVLLKLGTYGFVRILIPLFSGAFSMLAIPIAFLAMTSIVYGALVAMAQWDFKKLIAYSSVNHMGYVILGLAAAMALTAGGIPGVDVATARQTAINGAVLQMFNHGIITGALFLLVGLIYDNRTHVRDFRELGGGLWRTMPVYGTLLMIAAFASLGLPGLAGFVSEFMVFAGSFGVGMAGNMPILVLTGISVLGILVTAAFILWKVIGLLLLGPQNEKWLGTPDLTRSESGMLAPLIVFMFLFGIFPYPILELINRATIALAPYIHAAVNTQGALLTVLHSFTF